MCAAVFSRFMICCDCCGEWYHGDCIGISVSQGKRMERAGEDYVCVSCQERERKRKEQKEADRIMRLAKREQAKEKDTKNVFVKVCVGEWGGGGARSNSIEMLGIISVLIYIG